MPINGKLLKSIREERGMSQVELAESFKPALNKQTIYRWERDNPPVVRDKNLMQLADILGVDKGVLTGDLPLPPKAATSSTESAEGFYEMRVRADGQTRNAFSLASLRYGIPISEILKMAPLLLVHAAEESLARRTRHLNELKEIWSKESDLRGKFPHLPWDTVDFHRGENQEGAFFAAEQKSISARDILGKSIRKSKEISWEFSDGGDEDYNEWAVVSTRVNPFAEYLRESAVGRADSIEDEDSTRDNDLFCDYKICREKAVVLAGGDEELADSIQNGWVLIHEIPRSLLKKESLAERKEWLRSRMKRTLESSASSDDPFDRVLDNMMDTERYNMDQLPTLKGEDQ